jgi:hypothetical protein
VKPICQFEKRGSSRTDCFFQAYDGRWHGYWPSDDDQPRPYNLGREYLIEAARERAKEMIVFGVILIAAAWPVIAMIVEVIRFYKGRR